MTKVLGTIGFRKRGDWAANTSYRKDDMVLHGRSTLYCLEDHTSGTEFDSTKWEFLADATGIVEATAEASVAAADATAATEAALAATEEAATAAQEASENAEKAAEVTAIWGDNFKMADTEDKLLAVTDAGSQALLTIDKEGQLGINNNIVSESGYKVKVGESDYAYGIVDADGKVLFSIDSDGNVNFQGVPDDVRTELDSVQEVSDMIRTDENGSDTVFAILDKNSNVLASINSDGALMANAITGVCDVNTIDNENYVLAVMDKNGNVLFGVLADGTFYAHNSGTDNILEDESHEFLFQVVSSNNKLLFGIRGDGSVYCQGITNGAKEAIEAVEDKIDSVNGEIEVLKTSGGSNDFSNDTFIQLPFPQVAARVEITGDVPTSKYISKAGKLRYIDKQGNSFTKNILWTTQGNISNGYDKKNWSIDLLNSADEDDSCDVKFGNWVTQDGYHLKAYISDFWKIRSLCVYKHANAISETRDYFDRYPYDIILTGAQQTEDEVLKGGVGDFENEINPDAICRPDGFPVMLYINDTPWGLYTWNLKKNKDNYNIAKNDNDGLQIFFGDYMTGVFDRYNNAFWSISDYNLTDPGDTPKWDEDADYEVDDVVYDEETVDFEVGGKSSSVTIRRKFKCVTAYSASSVNTSYVSRRPSALNWRTLEIRNPKTLICREILSDGTIEYQYYDYDSPSDYSSTGYYERTHEVISGDMLTEKQATALGFSKKEYNRSVACRKTLEDYSYVRPVMRTTLTTQNLLDWGYLSEFSIEIDYAVGDRVVYEGSIYKFTSAHAAGEWDSSEVTTSTASAIKTQCLQDIFDEHHDISHNIDFFLVYNDCYYNDSITHNTLYTFYDGKKLFAHLYDTDISLGMNSTVSNSFPSVQTGLLQAHFLSPLYTYHKDEIKARWAELRDAGVISVEAMSKIIWDWVRYIGYDNYEQELTIWPDQPSYRSPVYWRMPAGSLQVLDDDGDIYHGYDESRNTEGDYDDWVSGKAYVSGDYVNYDGHSYTCTVAHTSTDALTPDTCYTCGYPNLGGVYDSPVRCITWFKKRIAALDNTFGYSAS